MSDAKITVLKNGPFRLEGENLQILDPTGTAYLRAVCSVFALHLQHLSGWHDAVEPGRVAAECEL